jgi:hypothetical protein
MTVEQPAPSVRVNLKAMLIIVIIAGLCLIALLHRRRTEDLAILSVTRGPLRPLTPTLVVDKSAIVSDVEAHRFEALDERLQSYQRQAEADIRQEANAHMAFETFTDLDPRFVQALDEWVNKFPNSYSAHLARAMLLFSEGKAARGDKWASETTTQQFARMTSYYKEGLREAEVALHLNPMLAEAYGLMITNAEANDGPKTCEEAAELGLKEVPSSFVIRSGLMHCFEPRWGGSYQLMDSVAREAGPLVPTNPRLRALYGFADADRANRMTMQHNYVGAVQFYTRAIDEGGDHALFYRGRGKAFAYLQRYDEAFEDLRRADQLWPQYPETLRFLAWVSDQTGKHEQALDELDLALRVGGPDPSIEQQRNELVAESAKGSVVTAGAVGD